MPQQFRPSTTVPAQDLIVSANPPSRSSSSNIQALPRIQTLVDFLLEPSVDRLSSWPARFTPEYDDTFISNSSQDFENEQEDKIKDHAPVFSSWPTWR
ncbi:hypothetical protein PUNSTDRAFT_133555 [Punctularia strigosozonata HHB-11173 SS5]|uniref:uncharacterized protein n=1 Tax=Punctularia strigosozonata (strain HHB-11173) TaxID=741275 RepID=UPI00044183CB|nr:uncharacterized protein PUNSTDRAFT_133555 [Punctularia strigosozonata HHB-11173 SS5]EIN09785.1 hypothetical protein PUNSTDRAFT_133555 [Punctularia strigosozonata HHB-11173 SS5]